MRLANFSSPYWRRIRARSATGYSLRTSAAVGPVGVVHPHVERRVLRVGEAALAQVELHRGHAEVEEDPVDRRVPELREHVADLVVHRVHEGDPLAVRREPLPAPVERVHVAVDADDVGPGQALEHGLGVTAETERGVDEEGAFLVAAVEGRCHESDDPVEQHRDVAGVRHRALARQSGEEEKGERETGGGGRREGDDREAVADLVPDPAGRSGDRRARHGSTPSCSSAGVLVCRVRGARSPSARP